jgi:hypothetical protein
MFLVNCYSNLEVGGSQQDIEGVIASMEGASRPNFTSYLTGPDCAISLH